MGWFTKGETTLNKKRLDRLRTQMQKRGIDLAVYGCGPGYQYLSGVNNGWRFRADTVPGSDLLLVPSEGSASLFIPNETGDLHDMLRKMGGNRSQPHVAVGDRQKSAVWTTLHDVFPHAEYSSGDDLLTPLRLIKDDEEISILRRAASLTDEAVRSALPAIKEGVSMRDLQLEIEMCGRANGATGTSFDIVSGFVQTGGGPTGSIFGYELDEGLRPGTTIFFDIGFVVDGYCSDWGRSVFFGTPEENTKSAYKSLQNAVIETIAKIEIGETRVCDLYPMIESSLDASGYGDFIRARLTSKSVGHQIGVEVHEVPWLEPQNTDPLLPGMVFCVEPKLWDDGRYYLRVEDMILITEKGAESLTAFDRELFEL